LANASYSSIWKEQKQTNAIVKAKMGEDGVLAEYLRKYHYETLSK